MRVYDKSYIKINAITENDKVQLVPEITLSTVAKPMIETVYNFGGGDEYKNSFKVFSMNYEDLNSKNIIDNQELLERRFKFF